MNLQSHFKNKLTSPVLSLSCAYIYVVIVAIILSSLGFYKNNTFFRWGTPVTFFGQDIVSDSSFYALLSMVFLHQLINNWVSTVVYPWIINQIQDYKTEQLQYSKPFSLLLINLHALYSNLDLMFIINGALSQVSFFLMILIADLISASIINWQYIRIKGTKEFSPLLEVV